MTKILNYLKDESGATAVEYGLIAAGIAVGIIIVVFAIGDDLALQMETLLGSI